MPTTYTPDPTATQSPADPPAPGLAPDLVLPNDGEDLVADSIRQPIKALGDLGAFLANPRATVDEWEELIATWRDSQLHRRTIIDHHGFLGGAVQSWQEHWDDVALGTHLVAGSGPWGGRWNYAIAGGGGGVSIGTLGADGVIPGDTVNPWGCRAQLYSQGIGPGIHTILAEQALAPVCAGDDVIASLAWDLTIHRSAPGSGLELAVGFNGASLMAGGTSAFSALAPVGAGFYYGGSGNWLAYTKATGGGVANPSTAIAPSLDTRRRFRVDVVGAGVYGTARVLFFVDGVLKSNQTVDIFNGATSTPAPLRPFIRMRNLSNSPWSISVGPMDFRANRWPGDVGI